MKKLFMIMTTSLLVLVACNSEKKEDKTEAKEEKMSATNAEDQEEKNKATAMASVNALLAGDVDGALKDVPVDPNVMDYGDGTMPPIKGVDSIKAILKSWRGALSEYKAENLWALADGEYVAVFGEWTGTFKDDFMGMKTAGKTFKVKDADVFKFNSEGKIIEHRNLYPSSAMMAQMGVGGK